MVCLQRANQLGLSQALPNPYPPPAKECALPNSPVERGARKAQGIMP
jgi:hypothetical protein